MTSSPFDTTAKKKRRNEERVDDRMPVVYERSAPHLAIDDVLQPLGESGHVYARSNRLVQVICARDIGFDDDITREASAPVIADVSHSYLWEVMSRVASWQRYDARSKKLLGCEPPAAVVAAIHTRGRWDHMPHLRGVSTVPIMRQDGSVCTQSGYDDESGLFYTPNGPKPVISGNPTRVDAEEAAEKLLEPVRQFPWVAPHHQSAWLSTVLARVAKPAYSGGAPMCVIDSNTPGAGKGKLVDASAIISTGLMAASSPYVDDDDELRKRITSHLRAGDQICLIDNVPGGRTVGWASLDNALTAGVWADRELGKSSIIRVPVESLWFVTGNNIAIGADASRRTLRVRIESDLAHPELRTGFDWDPLLPRLRQERPFLLGYAINLVRAYLLAGRPDVGIGGIGSYEGWSAVVRASMVWAGLPDPAAAMANLEVGLDEEADAHVSLLREWSKLEILNDSGFLSVVQVLGQVERRGLDDLSAAIQSLCPTRDGSLPIPRRLGKAFRGIMGRVRDVDGHPMKLVRVGTHDNKAGWAVVSQKSAGSGVQENSSSPVKTIAVAGDSGSGGEGGVSPGNVVSVNNSDIYIVGGKSTPPSPHSPPSQEGLFDEDDDSE